MSEQRRDEDMDMWLSEDWDTTQDQAEDLYEQAVDDCGLHEDEVHCDMAGTEYCDFRCPFRPKGG